MCAGERDLRRSKVERYCQRKKLCAVGQDRFAVYTHKRDTNTAQRDCQIVHRLRAGSPIFEFYGRITRVDTYRKSYNEKSTRLATF